MVKSKLATKESYGWQKSKHFTNGRGGHVIDRIVLHHNASTNPTAVPNVWIERAASAHYQVTPTGITACLNEADAAWNAGVFALNQRSIGIENLNSTGAPDWKVDPKTEENCAKLVADIATRYNIPIDRTHILKHSDNYGTECPGGLRFDWILKRAKEIANSKAPAKPTAPASDKLVVDGAIGKASVLKLEKVLGVTKNGVIGHQYAGNKKYLAAFVAITYTNGGTSDIKKLQAKLNVGQDGYLGTKTIKAWQKKLGVSADGYFGVNSAKALQKALNNNKLF